MRTSPSTAPVLPCQDLELVWKANNSRSIYTLSRILCASVLTMFTGSERGSEVNTRFGSQAPGLRVEEIHLQHKLETSIVSGAHLARAPSFLSRQAVPYSLASGLPASCQTGPRESSDKFTFSSPLNTNWP